MTKQFLNLKTQTKESSIAQCMQKTAILDDH